MDPKDKQNTGLTSGVVLQELSRRAGKSLTPAGRLHLVMELLSDSYEDDDGVTHKKEPLITAEQARELLGFEPDMKEKK